MQQKKKTLYEKSIIGVTGAAWIAGLLIAGSDSPFMPWINGVGLLLFFCSSVMIGKLLNPSRSKEDFVINPEFFQKHDVKTMNSKRRNRKINSRYALQV